MSFIDTEKLKASLGGKRQVVFLEATVSTNTDLVNGVKGGRFGVGDIIIAGEQSGGRGRRGKSFSSPRGGIYMSFCADNIEYGLSTVICAVAVSNALERVGCEPQIKWVNDIYLGGKKVCGILAQSVGDGRRAVIGVGINLKSALIPPELRDRATSLDSFIADDFSKEELICSVVSEYERLSGDVASGKRGEVLDCYRARLCHMGKKITLLPGGEICTTVGVDSDGRLAVLTETGDVKYLSSGEISIRINS